MIDQDNNACIQQITDLSTRLGKEQQKNVVYRDLLRDIRMQIELERDFYETLLDRLKQLKI